MNRSYHFPIGGQYFACRCEGLIDTRRSTRFVFQSPPENRPAKCTKRSYEAPPSHHGRTKAKRCFNLTERNGVYRVAGRRRSACLHGGDRGRIACAVLCVGQETLPAIKPDGLHGAGNFLSGCTQCGRTGRHGNLASSAAQLFDDGVIRRPPEEPIGELAVAEIGGAAHPYRPRLRQPRQAFPGILALRPRSKRLRQNSNSAVRSSANALGEPVRTAGCTLGLFRSGSGAESSVGLPPLILPTHSSPQRLHFSITNLRVTNESLKGLA